jgi:hypothetical protein
MQYETVHDNPWFKCSKQGLVMPFIIKEQAMGFARVTVANKGPFRLRARRRLTKNPYYWLLVKRVARRRAYSKADSCGMTTFDDECCVPRDAACSLKTAVHS